MTIKNYASIKDEILHCIEKINRLSLASDQLLSEIAAKLASDTLNLVVVGQFKRGKTCLINALIGSDLLPTAVIPLTSIVTILHYGPEVSAKVIYRDGRQERCELGNLADFITEPGNPKNIKGVKEVSISFPSPYLKEGLRLIDTPGVGSVYLHNTDVAYQYLPQSDAALFVLSVEQPLGQSEIDFLKDVRQYADRIFFLLNKIDIVDPKDVEASIQFTRQNLQELVGIDAKVYPISARLALEGKIKESDQLLQGSKLPAFAEVLDRFLMEEKGRILLLSATGTLLRLLSHSQLELELQLKSLSYPLEELNQKLMELESKKAEIIREHKSFDMLLDGEIRELITERLDKDTTAFKKAFTEQMERGFEEFCEAHPDLSLRELSESLEAFVVKEVERAFSSWHREEEAALAGAYQAICDSHVSRINQIIDSLLDFSARLFGVPFTSFPAQSYWTEESHFYYKFQEEPVGLDLLASSLTEVFPKYISDRFQKIKAYLFQKANTMIVRKRKRRMLEMIEMQAGRMRHDFTERLQESKRQFQQTMRRKMEATLNGIGTAIQKGVELRSAGEKELEVKKSTLRQQLNEMELLSKEIQMLRERAGSI